VGHDHRTLSRNSLNVLKKMLFCIIYAAINFTDEFRNVSVTLNVGDGSGRGWLGVVGVIDTRLV